MAQTKKKRHTKHRGNAAGIVEARGRTSRPPSQEVRKAKAKEQVRAERLSKPPTWKRAIRNASFMAPVIFLALLLMNHRKGATGAAVIVAILAFVAYVPGGYYLELFMWKRRIKDLPTTGVKRSR